MKAKPGVEIENNLAQIRQQRGFSAAKLAQLAGVSRQTIYAMEAGGYMPNTVVALRIARALEVEVEALFRLRGDEPAPRFRQERVVLLAGGEAPQPGQAVQLCRVDRHLMASVPSPMPWYFPASDAVIAQRPGSRQRADVQVFHPDTDFRSRLLVAGCDPGISVLARHLQPAGIELVLAHRNSSQSLKLLKAGSVHVAGTHLRDEASGESNLPEIGRLFSRNAVAVISFAVWEEGIVTARGNPKGIRGIDDFARSDLSIVNREPGAGSRLLLDTRLRRAGIDPERIAGYEHIALGHLPAAWQIYSGAADCCVATRAAARMFGLGFVPLVSERYDLAIRRSHLDLPGIQTLLDTLNRLNFRRELESLGGYDTRAAGRRVL
jgi:molybdate-binding protein/DNA-binding XRE family transcriptional regulator